MFQDVLLTSNLSNGHHLILFYFHLNQLRNFPAKTYRSVKKRIALTQRREGNTLLSGPISNQSACAMGLKTSSGIE